MMHAATDNEMYSVVSPVTELEVATVEMASAPDIDEAVARSHVAFQQWRRVAPGERARILREFARVVDAHVEELALLEVVNAGHTIGNARWEAANVRDVLNYYAGAPERLIGSQIPVPGGTNVTFHEAMGVVGVIVPWNFPMPLAAWAFAPALAAGNAVVLKPAEYTPLTALRLAELALEAGVPESVFTVLPGRGTIAGQRLVEHPLVRKVCFTGSTPVGRSIMKVCADQVKPVTLELGGKSANIIFDDGDHELAAASAPMAVFDNAGQDCCARSRILVQKSIYNEFMDNLHASVQGIRVSDPRDEATHMGPMISKLQRERASRYLEGGSIAFTGSVPDGPGFWMAPTVIVPGDTTAAVWREEVFGPVVAVLPFDTEEDAIEMANNTHYGLSGSVFTNNLDRAFRMARSLEVGTLSINSHSSVRYWTPFGGFKESGLGRELGPDGAKAFTEEKNVFIAHR
ncbi:aldehyde dehydrogenase family protein [Streptomyces sp. NPDC004610]|uniref:aldehyde dehydrogenase family protein n=1 Tax=unclassified Streptomyces TaxID=2593676 RepID=UPI00339FED5C